MKKRYGREHIDTLSLMKALADAYLQKGRFQEAEALHLKVLRIGKRKFGHDNLSVAESVEGLAGTYRHSRYQEAVALAMNVIEIFKKQLGPEDPDTLATARRMVDHFPDSRLLEVAKSLGMRHLRFAKRP
jgi:tetratricopeptide (TPR) repeat protein